MYGIDPHLWMDASLWARIAPTIAATLGELRPDCADQMKANAESYAGQLLALHDWVKASVATIPSGSVFWSRPTTPSTTTAGLTAIEVVGIQGVSTEAEAGVADIRATAKTVVDLGVPAVFVESTINPRTVQAVIDAAREAGQDGRVGGELYSDAMGAGGHGGGTYIGMIYENTKHIVEALGGNCRRSQQTLHGQLAEEWRGH